MPKEQSSPSSVHGRPPIVAVLGHVDHGKTSLLDTIRKANVASREHGGITQHIGAYQTTVKSKSSSKTNKDPDRKITFIDTPGHEAFAHMRSRGVTAADIAILVVAADDSVKPQTKESIEQIQKAGVPMIVAINKIDLEAANIPKVKQDLAKFGVQVEGFGGDIPWVGISAKVGTGIDELLDTILLVADMNAISGDPNGPLSAIVIEERVDKGKGMTASVVIKEGTLRVGAELFDEQTKVAKVRALFDDFGKPIKEALPSTPVEILGFTQLPSVGAILTMQMTALEPLPKVVQPSTHMGIPDFLKPLDEQPEQHLNIILKADTAGSLEAIRHSLPTQIHILDEGIGDITEADILRAKSSGAFVIGFHARARGSVEKLATVERVVFRTYTIIYELVDELTDVVGGMREVITKQRELGHGQIVAEFPFNGHRIAGIKVTQGRLARGDTAIVMRGKEEIAKAKIKSLRRGKDEVTKVEEGFDCGVLFDTDLDFQLDDVIMAVTSS